MTATTISNRENAVRRAAVKALCIGISVIIPLLGFEIFFRHMARCCPEPQGLFTAMQWEWIARHNRRNSLGFRDAEHHGPATRPRLAVVGDSFAWGWGIERNEDRYGERLADLLGWESVNASRWNTSTLDHIGFLKRILPLKPRAVVLLYVFNDADYLREPDRPSIPAPLLFDRSHLYQQILVRLQGFLTEYKPKPYGDDDLLAIHAGDLKRFVDIAAAHGSRAVVVPFPHEEKDVPFASPPAHESEYLRLVAALKKRRVPVWPIHAAFAGMERDALSLNEFDTHPNHLALRIAAEATLPYFAAGD